MRTLLLFSLMLTTLVGSADAQGQTTAPRPTQGTTAPPRPAQPATQPAQPAQPATQPAQPARRATPVATRSGMAIQVTTPQGATIPDVRVEILGPTDRSGETNASGQLNFPGLQAGTYRLRFSGEQVTTFEREVVLRAGQVADLDVTLNPAPPPREVPAPPPPAVVEAPPAPAALGPAGRPQTVSIVDLIEKDFVGREPRRESLLSCSGNARTTMIQLNETLPERLYDTGEASYYVLGGEGTVRIDGRDTQLETGAFVSVPRGIAHSFTRRGRRPLILLLTLSGAPCEEVK